MFDRLALSLAKLNNPAALTSAAIATEAADTYGLLAPLTSSSTATKATFIVSLFIINMLTVSIPGRLDDAAYSNEACNKLLPLSPTRGTTLVSPATWAFAIWGLIYTTEIAAISFLSISDPSSTQVSIASSIAIPFLKANIFQALWCAAFRPKHFLPPASQITSYLSFAFLSLTSFNLLSCVRRVGSRRGELTLTQFGLYFFPLSLHAGWTAAASLVNLNGAFAYNTLRDNWKSRDSTSESIRRVLGHGSVAIACGLATLATLNDSLFPNCGATISFVLAWALKAVQSGMTTRIDSSPSKKGTDGERAQRSIARIGFVVCFSLGVWSLKNDLNL